MCEQYTYRRDGTIVEDHEGKPLKRNPLVVLPTPCGSCPKVPDGAKQATSDYKELRKLAEDMTEQNRTAYKAYKRFKATANFPDDPIVEWYSGIIRDIEDAHTRRQQSKITESFDILCEILKVRR